MDMNQFSYLKIDFEFDLNQLAIFPSPISQVIVLDLIIIPPLIY